MTEALKEWEMFGISDMKKEVGFMQLREAVGELCYRGLIFVQCLIFYLYFGSKCACFTTNGITLRKEHGLQLLRRKGDVWWWNGTPVPVLAVQWCHLG